MKIVHNCSKKMLNILPLFLSPCSVPPNFSRPGGDGDTTSSPGFGGDVRDVILNNPISLYCETNAVPPPTLTWYKDGQLLTSNDKVLVLPGEMGKENRKKEREQDREWVHTNLPPFYSQVAECCRFPEPRLKTRAGTRVWLSTKQEKTPFNMTLEYYVSKTLFFV